MHQKILPVYIDNLLLFSSYISYVNRNKKSGYQKTSVIPPQAEGYKFRSLLASLPCQLSVVRSKRK
jgi:hypothetical protein